jgi:hypothetical protein
MNATKKTTKTHANGATAPRNHLTSDELQLALRHRGGGVARAARVYAERTGASDETALHDVNDSLAWHAAERARSNAEFRAEEAARERNAAAHAGAARSRNAEHREMLRYLLLDVNVHPHTAVDELADDLAILSEGAYHTLDDGGAMSATIFRLARRARTIARFMATDLTGGAS